MTGIRQVAATLVLFGAVLAAAPVRAQATDAERDAEIASLRQTVERLTRRIESLEAERSTATAPTAPVAPAATARAAPAQATAVQAVPVAPAPPPAPPAVSAVAPLPDPSPLPVHPSFDEDELAGARLDNALPPGDGPEGFFRVGDSTWLRLGGYAKLDAMYDTDDAGFSDMFITSTIPVGAQSGQGSFNMHARQTRLTLEGRRLTDQGWLRFMVQNDFFGAGGSYGYNLRHAWGQLGNTYAGYGWSAFMDLDAGPDTLDFAGPGVVPFGRVTSVRQYFPLRSGNQLVLAAEYVPPEISSTLAGVDARTTAPNLVFAMRHEGGSGHVQAGVLLRQLAYDGDAGRDEAFAGGVSLSGSWSAGYGGYLTWGALGGRGIAAYVGDLLGMGLDGVVDDRGSLQALDEWGGWAGYGHPWNADWRSTLTWGRLYLERDAWLAPQAFRRSDYVAANLIYAPAPSWSWGMELLYGRLQEQAGEEGDVFRFQTSLKYDFVR